MSSAVLGSAKKSDAILEDWRQDDDCVPEAIVDERVQREDAAVGTARGRYEG